MTKIDIISGFLGAGKTTLIKKLVGEVVSREKVVLIENEFGEIGIDGGFLQDIGIEMKEMNSGCICCSLVGDFAASLKEVVETYHPDRIIIEPSGVGKLSDVIKAIEGAKESIDITINSAVAVADASKCKMYSKNFGEFFVNQIAYADTIILSRTQGLSVEKMEKCMEIIRKHNEEANIITTPWDDLTASAIWNTIEKKDQLEDEIQAEVSCGCGCGCGGHHHEHQEGCGCGGHHHEHEHEEGCGCGHDHGDHHHHAEEVFISWGFETPFAYTKETLQNILDTLEEEKLCGMVLRAKGMLIDENGEWNHFDYVPGEVQIRKGSPQVTGKVCVIGAGLLEENLKKLFAK